jgi:hypothetical protein
MSHTQFLSSSVSFQQQIEMNAVEVRGAYKFYGKPKNRQVVLNKLDMTVEHGSM